MCSRSLSMNLNCTCLQIHFSWQNWRLRFKNPKSLPTDKPEDLCSGRKGLLILRKGPCKVLPFDSRTMGQYVRGRRLPPTASQALSPEAAEGHSGWKQSHHQLRQWWITTRWNSFLYSFGSHHDEKCKILIRLQNKWNWFIVYNYIAHTAYCFVSHF